MKTMMKGLAVALAGAVSLVTFNACAVLEVSASVQIGAVADFYTPLDPYGGWVEVDSYGRCWRPSSVEVGWQPYCYGHWVWTDVGWYWETDEPWGWACYHYGNWVHHPRYGWVWAPGVEWAPAWVSWRSGGGYIGWAPLAPRVRFGFFASVPAPPFVFVETARFHETHRPNTVIVNNTTIINKTTVINSSMKTETRTFADGGSRKVMVNQGPDVKTIEKATGKPVQVASIQTVAARTKVLPATERKAVEPSRKGGDAPAKEMPERKVLPHEPAPQRRPALDREPQDRKPEPKRIAPMPEPPAPAKPGVPPVNPGVPPNIGPDQPGVPGLPPDRAPLPPKGKGKNRGDDRDRERGHGRP